MRRLLTSPRSAGRVVETLTRTGGFSANVVRRRLLETLQHVLQVSLSLESMKPGGEGHISSVRVRLLHASVRTRILSLVKQRPEYYNVKDLGIPISDLDCIATLHIFSTSVVWHGLPRQGIWLRDREVADYLALWRLVAHYMGTPTESLESPATARAMMDSLAATQFNPTNAGKVLAQNIILGLENTAPAYASKEFMEALARHLILPMLSDRLGLPHPNWYYRALIYGYCFLVMVICYGGRLFPMLDRSLIAVCPPSLPCLSLPYPLAHIQTQFNNPVPSPKLLRPRHGQKSRSGRRIPLRIQIRAVLHAHHEARKTPPDPVQAVQGRDHSAAGPPSGADDRLDVVLGDGCRGEGVALMGGSRVDTRTLYRLLRRSYYGYYIDINQLN